MICNILRGHVGSVADINGFSLVSLYKTSHQSPSQSQDGAGKNLIGAQDLTNVGCVCVCV